MKFYNSMGPNPRMVRFFAAEAGIDLPSDEVDLMSGENRQEAYLAKNPHGQLPCLETDDGSFISEITAICEYLDEKSGGSALIGTTPEERGETRMWTRRVDLNICEPLANGFRFAEGLALFKDRIVTVPEAADGLKKVAQDRLAWLDGQLAGRDYLAGDRFSMADILLFSFLEFGQGIGQPLNPDLKNVGAWYERVAGRAAAIASA